MNKTSFLKLDWIILSVILILALSLRLYKIDIPLADAHSWRQADTAAVARNFNRMGFDFLHPKYDDLTSIESGIENPQGYRMVEFPLYNAIFAALYKFIPITSLEIYGRLTTAIFSLISIAVLYYVALKESGRNAAIPTALTFAVFPFFVFFSRVILPDTTAVSLMMLSIFFLYRAFEKNRDNIFFVLLSGIFLALALLVKPTVIFYCLVLAFILIRRYKFEVIKRWQAYLLFFIGLVPLVLWRLHISQYPEGIPASNWLLTQVNTYEGIKTIFLRPSFFRWMFYERIGIAIYGLYLSFFFVLGTIVKQKKYLLYSIFFSSMVFIMTFEGGNVQHTYYQTVAFPGLAIIVGLGVAFVIENTKDKFIPLITYGMLAAVFVASWSFSYYYSVKGYYVYPHDLTQISKRIRDLTKPEDKIVTDRLGDTTLLYLADRRGSPAVYRSPEEFKNMGYSYIVTANPDFIQELKTKNYEVKVEVSNFALIKL